MKILIACEESQAVCVEFRKLGFEAYSCDILPCSGGHPEWHIQDDVLKVIAQNQWDCMISFPPCTHLAVSGAAWFEEKRKNGMQEKAINFFMKIVNAKINHIAIENPVGIMSKIYKKPNQIINPFYFGDEARKKTCLWLKNLPPLLHTKEPNLFEKNVTWVNPGKIINGYPAWLFNNNKKHRSKTFPGIAKAMATQWGPYLKEKYESTTL